jgi:XRE family aerobic/anaerobic benzoate catabolism transcriptional regulator
MSSQPLLVRLGARLRAARERAGLTVSELSRLAGVSRRHVTEAEAGRANLTLLKLFALAEALERRPADLIDLEQPAAAPPRDRIALVGLRGAGKSTVGRALALALEVPFVELDSRVEEQAGLALAAIFDLHGRAGFRRFEAAALERVLSEAGRLVLAAGGSIVSSADSYERLLGTCRTVWLRARAEIHLERVLAQGDSRPVRGRPRALEELREILARREAAYARCELEVETSDRSVAGVVEEILARLGT